MTNIIKKTIGGVEIINSTPHEIAFEHEGERVIVPTAGVLINAKAVEVEAGTKNGVKLVKTQFQPSEEGEKLIAAIEAAHPSAIIVGSIIAAQAYPGRVFGMTPALGYERVAPQEKRMSLEKFTTF